MSDMGNKKSKRATGIEEKVPPNFESKKGGTAVLLIDPQNDFHEGGSLAVTGATLDSERLAAMIGANKENISQICVTLDSHHKLHIANPYFWVDKDGQHPSPFTAIPHQDILDGKWRPSRPELLEHVKMYTKELEDKGKFVLNIWPEHCLIGTPGHNVVESLNVVLQDWAGHHLDTINYVNKGTHPLTEMYSGISADVPVSSDTQPNTAMINRLREADRVLVCGQALSHCVNYTMRDLAACWPKARMKDLVLLSDGASPVTGFEKAGEEFVADMKKMGCTVCTVAEAFT